MVEPSSSWKCRVSCTIVPPEFSTAAWRWISKRAARSTERSELTFFVSERVPKVSVPWGRSDRLTSQRIWPISMRASETPSALMSSRSSATYALATSGARAAGPLDRLGDDLDEGDARAVVVEQRVGGAVDAAGGSADVRRLAGVLLHVGALDLHAEDLPVLQLDVQIAVEGDRLVVLGGLEVLRHVRIEVVLPGEAAPLGDLAVQREPDLDGGLDADLVDDRERARQPEADRTGLRVGALLELGGAAAEHLGLGAELDMDLEAHDGVVRREGVLVRLQVNDSHGVTFPLSPAGRRRRRDA